MNNLNENLASITMRGSKRNFSFILRQAKGRFPFLKGHCPPNLAGSAQTLSPTFVEGAGRVESSETARGKDYATVICWIFILLCWVPGRAYSLTVSFPLPQAIPPCSDPCEGSEADLWGHLTHRHVLMQGGLPGTAGAQHTERGMCHKDQHQGQDRYISKITL